MMKKIIGIFSGVAVLALLIAASVLILNAPEPASTSEGGTFGTTYNSIIEITTENDYSDLNPDSIIPASEITGNLPEKIIGSKDAKVIIYEYADYACSHCAEVNTTIKKMVEDYNGQIAVVYRGYLLSGYPNNVEAAAATTAASMQGYWEKYKNLVFSDQATWVYLKGDKVVPYFGELFVEASNGEGDLEKFYSDMASEAVAKRLAFEYSMGTAIELTGTPTFRINGEKILASDLQTTIDELLK